MGKCESVNTVFSLAVGQKSIQLWPSVAWLSWLTHESIAQSIPEESAYVLAALFIGSKLNQSAYYYYFALRINRRKLAYTHH